MLEGIQDFVACLDQVGLECVVSLFAVPGTAAGGAEAGLDGDQVFKQSAVLRARGFWVPGFLLVRMAWRHGLGWLLSERKTVRHDSGIHKAEKRSRRSSQRAQRGKAGAFYDDLGAGGDFKFKN